MTEIIKKKYCGSPWIEGVLRADGRFSPCCMSHASYGNWQTEGLKTVWHGDTARQFRQDILEGRFPHTQCRACYFSATVHTPMSVLWNNFNQRINIVGAWLKNTAAGRAAADRFRERVAAHGTGEDSWEALRAGALSVFRAVDPSPAVEQFFYHFAAAAEIIGPLLPGAQPEIEGNWKKIGRTLSVVRSFIQGDLEPPAVAPHRQPNLIEVCNARCIHCPGRYPGHIINGLPLPDGSLFKQMSLEMLEKSLAPPDDLLGFMINGSEFLFYPHWREAAQILKKAHVKLRISTNSICLTPANIDYLIDNDVLSGVNISIDGGTKETVEAIRVNVKFDRLQSNVRYLYKRLEAAQSQGRLEGVGVDFSFVLMKRNYRELPNLVRLIDGWRGAGGAAIRSKLVVDEMLNLPGEEYGELFAAEHHSAADADDLRRILRETQAESGSRHVPVYLFGCTLDEFIDRGFPFPECTLSRDPALTETSPPSPPPSPPDRQSPSTPAVAKSCPLDEIQIRVDAKSDFILETVRTRDEFMRARDEIIQQSSDRERQITEYGRAHEKWLVSGRCDACGQETDFLIDWLYSDHAVPCYRERLLCQKCQMNNRQRFSMSRLKGYIAQRPKSRPRIHIYEQVTPYYKYASQFLSAEIIGSEYLGSDKKPGEMIGSLRHEDALHLSFSDESLDAVSSNDVLEHVPDVHRALAETWRVLARPGRFMFSVPFFPNQPHTVQRARISDGRTVPLLPEKYHGDPLQAGGSLVCYDFGWDFLDYCRSAGFSDAYLLVYHSFQYGHLGEGGQLLFVAEKWGSPDGDQDDVGRATKQ